jgi:ABC-type transport system substrate-binding protein
LWLAAGCGFQSGHQADEGKVLYGSTTRIRGFDPVRAGDVSSSRAMGKVYEGLYQYVYHARPYRVEPLLAEGLPEVSKDGLTYTIRIRPGIRFQDDPCFVESNGQGRELTAEDFVYSIKRVADQKNASTGFWAFRDRIEGLDDFREQSGRTEESTNYDQAVAGLEAIDRYTLRIRLRQPYPQLLWILTMPYAYAIPREAVEYYGEAFFKHPVGTGPFVLSEWRRNYRLVYDRNPRWHAAQSNGLKRRSAPFVRGPGGPRYEGGSPSKDGATGADEMSLPGVDRIVEVIISDSSTRWLAFMRGQMDWYADISRDNWEAVINADNTLNQALVDRGIRMTSIPALNTFYIGFNMDDPVVGKNARLRQALSCAFNTEAWVRFYNGRIARATGPVPPGVAGAAEEPSLWTFDLERARELLAEAGYPEGVDPATGRRLELTLELGKTDTEMRESTELIIAFMNKIGVRLVPSYNNKPTLFRKIERRDAQMFRLSWFADYPDAENFLQLFYSPNASPGPNRVNYGNPEFDRLYEQARTMQDSPERTALYRQMGQMIINDAPWIFMHHTVDYTLYHPWLENYVPHDFPYGMEKYYRIGNRQ